MYGIMPDVLDKGINTRKGALGRLWIGHQMIAVINCIGQNP